MEVYRITKYDPINRNEKGHYIKDEWTSISDVGRTYDGCKFTALDYIKVEESFIKAYELVLRKYGVDYIELQEPEKSWYSYYDSVKDLYNDDLKKLYDKIKEHNTYNFTSKSEVLDVIRLCLREHIWGIIVVKDGNSQIVVHIEFGYDYYTYLSLDKLSDEMLKSITDMGLFVEAYPTPLQMAELTLDRWQLILDKWQQISNRWYSFLKRLVGR